MRTIIFQGDLYIAVKDIVEKNPPIEELEDMLDVKYKDTGVVRKVRVFDKRKKFEILREYRELIKIWNKKEVVLRICIKYHVKKTLLNQWLRSMRNE